MKQVGAEGGQRKEGGGGGGEFLSPIYSNRKGFITHLLPPIPFPHPPLTVNARRQEEGLDPLTVLVADLVISVDATTKMSSTTLRSWIAKEKGHLDPM